MNPALVVVVKNIKSAVCVADHGEGQVVIKLQKFLKLL